MDAMRDKISRLSRGIIDIETPSIRVLPESVSNRMIAGSRDSFELEVVSTNGFSIRGAVFSDDPRVSSETRTFTGRRVHITVQLNAAGLRPGEHLTANVCLVTNAGEIRIPCDILCEEKSPEAGGAAALSAAKETELSGSGNYVEDPLIYGPYDSTVPEEISGTGGTESAGNTEMEEQPEEDRFFWREPSKGTGSFSDGTPEEEQKKLLCTVFPEDMPLFEGVLAALIRAKDESPEAFSFYREAIRRNLSVTRLYESYIHAYPADSDEMMPREVLLYYSYDRDPEAMIREKLYKNVLLYVDRDSELYGIYEPRISHFAMNCVLERRISENLRVIYDRMIYPGMIDRRAAECLPDILKCRRILVKSPDVKYVTVRYPELGISMRAEVKGRAAYVPVYFQNAAIVPDSGDADISDEALFDRPDLLRRCFDIFPEHRMLLLSAVREIADRGTAGEDEISVCMKALSVLKLKPAFRSKLIRALCHTEGEPRWINSLSKEDYTPEIAADICRVLLKYGHAPEAWEIMKSFGCWEKDSSLTADLLDALIRSGSIPMADDQPEPVFVSISKSVFDKDPSAAPDSVCELLGYAYEGPSGEMYRVMSELLNRKRKLYDLPENVLAYLLFTDSREHIDETFLTYIDHCAYTDMMVRAYLIRRSADYFLDEEEVIGSILFEALFSYLKAVDDPLKQPELMLLALTKYWSEKDTLTAEETEFCQLLTDKLIADGLVFRYTKVLRKKIRVPREICDRFYVEYHGDRQTAPRLMVRIRPDEKEFHPEDMKRVYRNIYVMSTLLFMGDEMHYLIYHVPSATQPSEEGVIKVTKFHRQKDDRFECLNYMLKAIADRDRELLRENMLKYVETREVMKELYKLK